VVRELSREVMNTQVCGALCVQYISDGLAPATHLAHTYAKAYSSQVRSLLCLVDICAWVDALEMSCAQGTGTSSYMVTMYRTM